MLRRERAALLEPIAVVARKRAQYLWYVVSLRRPVDRGPKEHVLAQQEPDQSHMVKFPQLIEREGFLHTFHQTKDTAIRQKHVEISTDTRR